MDDFLTPVSTIRITGKKEADVSRSLVNSQPNSSTTTQTKTSPTSTEDALQVLKQQPSYDELIATLRFLSRHHPDNDIPTIRLPSPTSAQVVQVLVSEIVTNHWIILKEDAGDSKNSGYKLLLYCLSSITGINAILVRLRALIQEYKSDTEGSGKVKRPDIHLNLETLLDLLATLLKGDGWILEAWQTARTSTGGDAATSAVRMRPRVQEILALFGGGRIVSLAAEAEAIVKANKTAKDDNYDIWVADAQQYTTWLGRNIVTWQLSDVSPRHPKFGSELFSKGLKLGHGDALTKHVLGELVLKKMSEPSRFGLLLSNLPPTEQRKVLFSILKLLSSKYLDRLGHCESEESKPLVAAVAGALGSIVAENSSLKNYLVEWLTGSSGAGLGEGVGIRRAVLAVVSRHRHDIVTVLEKSLGQFGDQLYIKHSPMLQQEAHVEVLLLSAGYVHRVSPIKLTLMMRTGVWLNAISNRLAAPHQKARLLGMVVGEALSNLVDKGDKRLNFDTEKEFEDMAIWSKGLTQVSDEVGSIEPLFESPPTTLPKKKAASLKATHAAARPPAQPPQTGFIIEELSDEEGPGDDGLVPYAKPESDAEDSDDDPTLIRRDKPKAPVYVRDLIRYLRDTDNYDLQKLALTSAPTLIRRKAEYGTEVKEHADELAGLLIGLSDKFDMEDFDDLRLQGMIALVVAQPKIMGPWFAKTFFDGDFSISQRASVLIVLGLSSRELAGFEASTYSAAAAFPSKTLPERVEKLYLPQNTSFYQPKSSSSLKALPPNALDGIAHSIADNFLAPMAAEAADSATGPNALKLSTFTFRLNNPEKVRHITKTKPRIRSIPNTTASLLSSSFFTPLISRFQAALHSSSSRIRGILFNPYLLSLYIKTLALIIHASGPSTLSLPQMTVELWRLLLNTSVRTQAVGDLQLTQAILLGFMALLDVNEDRMRDLCQEMGRELIEAKDWVAGVFGNLRGGDEGGEEEQVKMLAAGVLVRLGEGIEKWQLVLVGDLIGF
ncbi:telomere length regulation protein-domain-containing protein [Triangularia verruculosa]|uniref:Telomere length regulation protein-domain-containing protein n=1 Tax=Triangularia verruculosa TaxID=2587418 RepID=A0AAN7AQZ7_9PEZI|nr:telomere length regulation protein-domain-containing protein [Triangularia verruculosa]